MSSFLKARRLSLQQNRIREAMRRVDPEGVLIWSLQQTTVSQRSYNVRSPGRDTLLKYIIAR